MNDDFPFNICFLQEIQRLELELGGTTPPRTWKQTWSALETQSSSNEPLARTLSVVTRTNRHYGRSVHKRSTMDLLVKGKTLIGGESAKVVSRAHHFERYNYTIPTHCDCCHEMLWGFSKTG